MRLLAPLFTALVAFSATALADEVPSALTQPLPSAEVVVPSEYSDIRIRDEGTYRSMYFARPDGTSALETRIDRKAPSRLVVPYTRSMFSSYLYVPKPRRALLVGLGGGAMVHFLKGFDEDVLVTAVDIDPAVVASAAKYFGVRPSANIAIQTADAFEVLAAKAPEYDVIWMDAFLQPSADTDGHGVPLRLKTLAFWRQVRSRLSKDGVLVINVNTGPTTRRDLGLVKEAFGTLYALRPRGSGNLVAIAPRGAGPSKKVLAERAETLARRDRRVGFDGMPAQITAY